MKTDSPILITIGDPNGIGPEIAVKAAAHFAIHSGPRVVLVGDSHVVAPLASDLGYALQTERACWGRDTGEIALHAVDHLAPCDAAPGAVSAAAGRATVGYLQDALTLFQSGQARAIVASPHSETAVNASGRLFSGYPQLLQELLGAEPDSVFMMFVGGGHRIVHATLHEGLRAALDRLTPELIERAAVTAATALKSLGIPDPRIGLFGINPHASEGGLFGSEDREIVEPARQLIAAQGVDVSGPEGADTMLARPGYDAFVAMYHDQGHIPIKLLAGRTASALSIGGGVLFSSVGHGAAFDIAGQNRADPEAVIRTVNLLAGVQ